VSIGSHEGCVSTGLVVVVRNTGDGCVGKPASNGGGALSVGTGVGTGVGCGVGTGVGLGVGTGVGTSVGTGVGAGVGLVVVIGPSQFVAQVVWTSQVV